MMGWPEANRGLFPDSDMKKRKKRLLGRRKRSDNYTEAADSYAVAATVSAVEEEELFSISSATCKKGGLGEETAGNYCRLTYSYTMTYSDLFLSSPA